MISPTFSASHFYLPSISLQQIEWTHDLFSYCHLRFGQGVMNEDPALFTPTPNHDMTTQVCILLRGTESQDTYSSM
jgi:hypothetical protein